MDAKNIAAQSIKKYWKPGLLVLSCLLIAIVLWMIRQSSQEITVLERPEVGQNGNRVELWIQEGNQNEAWSWKGEIAARIYSAVELEERMEMAENYILEHLVREGQDENKIIDGVNLVDYVPEADVTVYWKWEEQDLLNRDGDVLQENLTKPVLMVITAELHCQDLTEYLQIPLYLFPEELTPDEKRKKELEKALRSALEKEDEAAEVVLPNQWDGTAIRYYVLTEHYYWLLPLMVLCVFGFRLAHIQEEEKKRQKERKEEMQLQYPDFVSRFVVLLGAGMNLSSVWLRLAQEYERSGKTEALFEEVYLVAQQLRNGEAERQIYESFGRRAGIPVCQRFSSILTQNLRMGSERVLEQLEYEVVQAMEERKAHARRRGEEMGTKLLFPMLVQMLLILAMVMLPAWMSM